MDADSRYHWNGEVVPQDQVDRTDVKRRGDVGTILDVVFPRQPQYRIAVQFKTLSTTGDQTGTLDHPHERNTLDTLVPNVLAGPKSVPVRSDDDRAAARFVLPVLSNPARTARTDNFR